MTFNRIFNLIVFDEDDNIICTCDFMNFETLYRTVDRIMYHSYTDMYEYKDEFVDCKEGSLYISIKKKKSVDF